ncbi:MAG: carbohydrate-binding protein [Hamadaea sp.]|nr:carbohydrate-binding protein [Hamadaea sp.]
MRRTLPVLAAVLATVLLPGPALAAPTRYEAETSPATCAGLIESNHAGYSGSGFCNGNNAVGAAVQFTVTAASAGTATLSIRYANGTTTGRPADILVNGSVVAGASAFDGTGAWATWATKTVTASVNAGTTTIRISPTTANGLPNIDFLDLEVGVQPPTGKQMEDLDRGLISVRSGSGNFVSWRMLGTEPASVTYRLYRGSTLVTTQSHTNYYDSGAAQGSAYTVRAVINGVEQPASPAALQIGSGGYLDVPLSIPGGGTTPSGEAYTYSANDASVGDLDGDGQYEIVLKWDPSNAKDNSQSGYTGNVYIDAYRLNGQRLWRIDLGRNIRAGAHYTQFQVYDYDGDGRAEVAMKTADATVSGTGQVIGNSGADYRNSSGYVLSGPEYLTMFDGLTGAARSTVNYEPARGTVSAWGDSYGNRVDRFLAGTAYLDGSRPSLIMARGYYTRSVVVAWDFRNGTLTRRWTFDSDVSGSQYRGQGNHQLSVADLDADGRDEIVYGSMAINDNGSPLWNTGNGHGDALHVGDLIPSRSGVEVFKPTEDGAHPADFVTGSSGAVVWGSAVCGCDNGRGVAGDVYAGSPGAEVWSSAVAGLRSASSGAQVSSRKPGSTNFLVWWDADPVRELLDGNHVDKYGAGGDTRLLTGSDVASNNGTKATPALSGDIFGDWREEVIWRTSSSSALRIYTTTVPTSVRIFTLAHDPQYRVALAWQNTAYNQPPHPSFYLGDGMATPPSPSIYVR